MTVATATPKVNLGCGKFPLEGYVNVDAHENAEVMGNVWELSFRDIEEVRMDHFLEHFGWRETVPLLEHVRKWMMRGALLFVEVPDIERIMERGTHGDWLRYLYGSQQHEGEYHKTGFTVQSLSHALVRAHFVPRYVTSELSDFQTRRGMPVLKAAATA